MNCEQCACRPRSEMAQQLMVVFLLLFAVLIGTTAFPAVGIAAETGISSSSILVEEVLPQAEQEGSVSSVETFHTTFGAAKVAFDPQVDLAAGAESTGTSVNLVVAHGVFTDELAHRPVGAPAPTGDIMAFAVNQATGQVLETYVGNRAPTAELGSPVFARDVSLAARTSQASKAILARVHPHRVRAHASTWGNKCSAGNGHHCYALARWKMKSGEQVIGIEAEQNTMVANVPNSEQGDFVDGEAWVSFSNSPAGNQYWTEMGQDAGEYEGCCSLHWFYAYQNHSGYHQVVNIGEIHFNEWAHYYMLSAGSGVWCWNIGPNGEVQWACVGGFEATSKQLEDGTEAATEAEPAWYNGTVTSALWTNGTWHTWNFAKNFLANETGEVSFDGLCVTQIEGINYPGNIYTGAYGYCP